MTKYEKISVLAKETARSIGENKESWMNYLDVASRLYKYPFEITRSHSYSRKDNLL